LKIYEFLLVTKPHRFSNSGANKVNEIWEEICDNLKIKSNLNTFILNKVNKSFAREQAKKKLYKKI